MRRAWLLAGLLLGCAKPGDGVDPRARADGHYLAGQSAYLKGDFAEAHTQFAEVKKWHPEDPRLPAAEGEVYLAEVKLDEAVASFEEAARRDPRRGTTWSRLAYLYSLKGKKAEARAAVAKALAANARDSNALETLADLELEAGEVDGGVQHLLFAAEAASDPDGEALVLQATAALEKAGRGAEVLAVLEGAARKGLAGPGVHAELGDRLVAAARLEDAIGAYTAAAKGGAGDPSLWELVGELQRKLGRPQAAREAWAASLAVKDRAVVHVALARLCREAKDEACVAAELDRALATASGEEMRETTELADLLVDLGREKDALTLLRAVSEEAEQAANVELHLKTARLAKTVKDDATVKAACARALAKAAPGARCP